MTIMTKEDFEIEQYKALRDEILRAREDGNQVMSLGLAAVGFALAGGVKARGNLLGFMLFALFVPALCVFGLSMYFATYDRISHASYFLTGVEFRIKQAMNACEIPTWERWLCGDNTSSHCKGRHIFLDTEDYSGVAAWIFRIWIFRNASVAM